MAKTNEHKGCDDDWPYFDDCPICQGMKEGQGQTVEDLKKLFDEANQKQREKQS